MKNITLSIALWQMLKTNYNDENVNLPHFTVTFLITHDLKTAQNADQILYLEDGKY